MCTTPDRRLYGDRVQSPLDTGDPKPTRGDDRPSRNPLGDGVSHWNSVAEGETCSEIGGILSPRSPGPE